MAVEEEEKDRRRSSGRSKSSEADSPTGSAKSSEPGRSARVARKRPTAEVGSALRSVYQKTIDEDIPPEMLDLLGKLG